MGGFKNYGPFLGTLNIRCRIIIYSQKGPLILRTTHVPPEVGGTVVAEKLLCNRFVKQLPEGAHPDHTRGPEDMATPIPMSGEAI